MIFRFNSLEQRYRMLPTAQYLSYILFYFGLSVCMVKLCFLPQNKQSSITSQSPPGYQLPCQSGALFPDACYVRVPVVVANWLVHLCPIDTQCLHRQTSAGINGPVTCSWGMWLLKAICVLLVLPLLPHLHFIDSDWVLGLLTFNFCENDSSSKFFPWFRPI